MFKKIITSIILVCFIFVNAGTYFAKSARAQETTWYHTSWYDWHVRVFDTTGDNEDEIFGERYTAAQVEWVIYGIGSFFINHFAGAGLSACIIQYGDNMAEFGLHCTDDIVNTITMWIGRIIPISDAGSVDSQGNALAVHKNPVNVILSGDRPISGIGYVKNAVSKFTPVTEVSAQGFGFEAADSMRELWKAVRDVTYFFLILMIIAMSFLIMFRFKINPQTVITVQSALPKIIGALILITFSYAIAGFMIDLLYVVIGVVAAVFQGTGLFENDSWTYLYEALSGVNFGQGIIGMMIIYGFLFTLIALFTLFANPLGLIGLGVGIGATGIVALPLIIVAIVLVISLLAIIFILLKTMWVLIKSFITVLLLVAVGPIFIITGGFAGWLKNLASNLAVFAAIGPMLAIAFLFLANALPNGWEEVTGPPLPAGTTLLEFAGDNIPFHPNAGVLGDSNWIPPFLPFGYDLDMVWLIASFVVMTLIPNVANMIKSAIAGKPFGAGTAIGAVVGGAAGLATYPLRTTWGAYSEAQNKYLGGLMMNAAQPHWERVARRFGFGRGTSGNT